MADARLATPNLAYNRCNVQSVTSFTTFVPTATRPTGILYDSVQAPLSGTGNPSLLIVAPWHSNNSATSLGFRLWGWTAYTQTSGTKFWIPRLLVECVPSVALSAVTIDGAGVYFYSTMTVTASITPAPVSFNPAAIVTVGQLVVDPVGSQIVTGEWRSNSSQFSGWMWTTI